MRRHGGSKHFLIGNELFIESPELTGGMRLNLSPQIVQMMDNLSLPEDFLSNIVNRLFRLGRMFRQPFLPEFRPDPDHLIELGRTLSASVATGSGINPDLPAGYVFLGQFIDHDLSFDATRELTRQGTRLPEETESKRSPSLDLDSLYGLEPDVVKQSDLGKVMYAPDGVRLRVGDTLADKFIKDPNALKTFPNDLPRGFPEPKLAAIVDERNDENLATAQTHVAFIRFHNAVVDSLAPTLSGSKLFDAAREKVIRHYQWLILFDYLPRIIEESVLKSVLETGSEYFVLAPDEEPFIPIEFSVAAFRLGHSMIPEAYEWNRIFQSKPPKPQTATLSQLFTFTGQDMLAQKQLPSSWPIDWTRFYDFTGIPGITNNPNANFARRIDPSLVAALTRLAMIPEGDQELRSLPVRNLLRGRLLGLPTGQEVARRLNIPAITAKEFANEPQGQLLMDFGFDLYTPLWFYILVESKLKHQGRRLGPVGSRIIAETFVTLIRNSRISILDRSHAGQLTWKPDLGLKPNSFSVPELLAFVHNASPNSDFINPMN